MNILHPLGAIVFTLLLMQTIKWFTAFKYYSVEVFVSTSDTEDMISPFYEIESSWRNLRFAGNRIWEVKRKRNYLNKSFWEWSKLDKETVADIEKFLTENKSFILTIE